MIRIQNTLTGKKEEFKPLKPSQVKMYACGVTVYDHCHIGHARSLYLFQVIKKYLEFRGYNVSFVRNITDVDDKIINKARAWADEQGISLEEAFEKVRKTYIESYREDLQLLNLPLADSEPQATKNIEEMKEYIKKLIDKGYAYEAGGSVYFSVRKFKDYGKLSGKKIDDLLESVRIDSDPDKKDPLDFALWKKTKEDEPCWPSPWGKGRPGWHIECSVMSQKYLGVDTLDIHGGGRDLVFPHHENELAQSEALTGKPFACYWIHHGLLSINNQKMAKSLGNFVTIKDIVRKYPADILKLFYLQAHYASTVDFSWERMDEAKKALDKIAILYNNLKITIEKLKEKWNESNETAYEKNMAAAQRRVDEYKNRFIEYMDDDFNTARALSVIFDLVNECNRIMDSKKPGDEAFLDEARKLLEEFAGLFLLSLEYRKELPLPAGEIEAMVEARKKLKQQKDYKAADGIRADLEKQGIILEDKRDGTTVWRVK